MGKIDRGSTSFPQARYDSFVQEIYKDILKKEGYVKEHGKFVRKEKDIVRAVEFTSGFGRDDKKKETLRFRIWVEARLENETLLRRENRLTTGKGAYTQFFPGLPKRNFWTGKMKYSEEDLKLIEAFRIGRQTDLAELKTMVEGLLRQALRDMMRFQTEEQLVDYLNAESEEDMRTYEVNNRRHVLFEFAAYGVLGVGACLITGEWFIMAFVSILYYMIIIEDMDLSDVWFRRMLAVPIIELLVMSVLFVLLWQKVTDNFAVGKLCIALSMNGLVHLVDHIYNQYVRKKMKEFLNNRRFWGGA